MDDRGRVHTFRLRSTLHQSVAQQPRGAGKGKLGMVSNEQRPVAGNGPSKFARNHGTRAGLQSRRQMFLIVDEDKILGRCRFHAGHGTHFGPALANQAGSDCLSDLL